MSLLKMIKAQLGLSSTAANNFVLDASADNGTMKLARGSGQDIMTVAADGTVTFPQNTNADSVFVNFNGTRNVTDTGASTNGQPVLIRNSNGVTSVVKDSVGQYTVNFTSARGNANFAASILAGAPTLANFTVGPGTRVISTTTLSCTFIVLGFSSSATWGAVQSDSAIVHFAIVGE